MEANKFIKEVYRRMELRSIDSSTYRDKNPELHISYDSFINDVNAENASYHYEHLLPKNKNAKILDIGFGNGWFMAACVKLGYTNIYGAEFNGKEKMTEVCKVAKSIKSVFDIDDNIGDFLSTNNNKYDFIHLSHVIEHIPKHSLLYIVDALYASLNKNGILLLRTPNMEGPLALTNLYITPGHEFGFSSSNLGAILTICGFDDVSLHNFSVNKPTIKQRFGNILRSLFILFTKFKFRLFGDTMENRNFRFGLELIVSAKRGSFPELFNKKYR